MSRRQNPWWPSGLPEFYVRARWLLRRPQRRAVDFAQTLSLFLISVVIVIAFLWLGALLIEKVTRHSLMISDIGVPKDLEAEGYTSAIAALRLHDALDNYANTANSTFQSTPRYLSDEEPTVEVPSLGLPLDYVADTTAHLLRFLRFPERQRLSGEITEQGKRQLALVLRLNDSVIVDATSPPKHGDVSSSDSDLLFQQAAKAAFQETDPYIVASHLYHEGNSIAAWAVAEAISDGSMPSDAKNNTMAHVLLATIYTDEGKYEFAERNIAEALQADDNLPVAHYNLR
ncbi:MAG: hypothetical protein ACLPVO_13175 [Desulfomonilaceae bacterium]